MDEDRLLKWLDTVSKILIPVVIAVAGFAFTYYQGKNSTAQVQAQREADDARRDLDRDTSYLKMLVSTNADEKKLGLQIIDVLSGERKFSKDLIPVLTIYAGGRSDDPLTQLANKILSKVSTQSSELHQEIDKASANAPTQVYIQISKENQRPDALKLRAMLDKLGFSVPGIQLVEGSVATKRNYIRFFSAPGARQASTIKQTMDMIGYTFVGYDGVQDFSKYTQTPLPSLEVWVGENQGPI